MRNYKRLLHLPHLIYNDFLMPSRLGEYEELLRTATDHGYGFLPIRDYARLLQSSDTLPDRLFILRHDVDSDVATAQKMFLIERKLNIKSSYYFRLSTVDVSFMTELEQNGSEASYHFEEIAIVAKRQGIRSRAGVDAHLGEIRGLFRRNLTDLRRKTALAMETVAAHGDFLNSRLGLPNQYLLNEELRNELGIVAEAYDQALAELVSGRFSDGVFPANWRPSSPLRAIESGAAVIYLLVHPRWWQRNIRANAHGWGVRLGDGLLYWARCHTRVGVVQAK